MHESVATAVGSVLESYLVGTEEAGTAWNSSGDEPKLAHDALEALEGHAFGSSELGEDGFQRVLVVSWELESMLHEIDDHPAQHLLSSVPAAVALGDLLHEGRLVDGPAGYEGLAYHAINGLKEAVMDAHQVLGPALRYLEEVVHKDIGVGDRSLEGPVRHRSR